MLLENTKETILNTLDIQILNSYGYIEDLDKRIDLIKLNLHKLFEIFKGNDYLFNELSVLENVFNHLDMEYIIELINKNSSSLYIVFGNPKVLDIKGVEIVEKINLIFYYVINNNLHEIKPNRFKTQNMEKMMCIAMLEINKQYLTKLGFYGQEIKQAMDYATEYLQLNKINNEAEKENDNKESLIKELREISRNWIEKNLNDDITDYPFPGESFDEVISGIDSQSYENIKEIHEKITTWIESL